MGLRVVRRGGRGRKMSDGGYMLYCELYKSPSAAQEAIEDHVRRSGGGCWGWGVPTKPQKRDPELDRKLQEIERAFYPNGRGGKSNG